MASRSRRASLIGARSGGRSITIPIVRATSVAMASDITVTCLTSTIGVPPISILFSAKVPSTVSTGIVSAGMNSLFPQRFALSAS
jgi:hypothetical protein